MIFEGRPAARGRWPAVVLALLATATAAVLTGCQRGGVVTVSTAPPATSPTTTAGPSGAGTGGAAYDLVPPAAREHTYSGAQSFAEFYVQQVNRAGAPIDPEALRAFGMPTCSGCTGYVRTVSRLRTQGFRYAAPAARVTPASDLPDAAPKADLVVLNVVGRAVPVTVLDGSGAKVDTTGRGRFDLEFCLEWDQGRWQISSLQGGVAS